MVQQKQSLLKKCTYIAKKGVDKLCSPFAMFISGLTEEFSVKSTLITHSKLSVKSPISDINSSLRIMNKNVHNTTKKMQKQSEINQSLTHARQTTGYQASKCRLISRMSMVRNQINSLHNKMREHEKN